jgi:hypothetical protein
MVPYQSYLLLIPFNDYQKSSLGSSATYSYSIEASLWLTSRELRSRNNGKQNWESSEMDVVFIVVIVLSAAFILIVAGILIYR